MGGGGFGKVVGRSLPTLKASVDSVGIDSNLSWLRLDFGVGITSTRHNVSPGLQIAPAEKEFRSASLSQPLF
jgi:hypothetical protein